MKYITSILFLLIIISCTENDKKINEEISQNCNIESPSKNLQLIASFLKENNYSFIKELKNEELIVSNSYWENPEDGEKIIYSGSKYILYSFKKKTPINGNYYPKFQVFEFCFDSKKTAMQYHEKYNYIVKTQEKNYGYVLLNGDRLLYFQTGVNMYSFILNDLKNSFEKIINDN